MAVANIRTPAKSASHSPVVRVKRSKIQGRGVFAARALRAGERLIEYTGERIAHTEASRRYDDSRMRRHHTFLFHVSSRTCIDGAREGNAARFVNHSCEPNCESVVVRGRVYLFALRDIAAGTELTYDYNYTLDGDIGLEDLVRYRCRCGAKRCRGTLLGTEARQRAGRAALKALRALP